MFKKEDHRVNKNSQKIRELVRMTGMDVLSLAVAIDASEKSVYKWMNGTSNPNLSHYIALVELANKVRESNKKKVL